MKQIIYLYIQIPDRNEFTVLGRLSVENGKGEFTYSPNYPIDWVPDEIFYPLVRGKTYLVRENKGVPNFIMDIVPDAWGRSVLRRIFAKEKDTNWSVIDYLHYSNNADRFGALCVGSIRKVTQKAVTENFQNFVKLDEFLDFANAIRTGEEIKKINLALAQTTSLGGAHPKITLYDDKKLYLAKPKDIHDPVNIPRVEYACLSFAKKKGFNVVNHKLLSIQHHGRPKDILILERFDRKYDEATGRFIRYPMLSGLTLLHAEWSTTDHSRWSYPLLANEMHRKKIAIKDIHELYKRMLFNALIGNDDDHLKNHAFIYRYGSWHLAPLYDVVPQVAYKPQTLTMMIGTYGNKISRENLLSSSAHFKISTQDAENMLDETLGWKDELKEHYREHLTKSDFEHIWNLIPDIL